MSLETTLLYMALSQPIGLAIQVADFELAQARLYKARDRAQDPQLAQLTFRRPPDGKDWLWLIKIPKVPEP